MVQTHAQRHIGKILASLCYGKGYEEIVKAAEEMGTWLIRMNRFQDTRWSQAESKVYKRWLDIAMGRRRPCGAPLLRSM
jgi:hypothetical protein